MGCRSFRRLPGADGLCRCNECLPCRAWRRSGSRCAPPPLLHALQGRQGRSYILWKNRGNYMIFHSSTWTSPMENAQNHENYIYPTFPHSVYLLHALLGSRLCSNEADKETARDAAETAHFHVVASTPHALHEPRLRARGQSCRNCWW